MFYTLYMSPGVRKPTICMCENTDADQLRGKLISAFVFAAPQCFFFLNKKFPAYSHLQWLYSLVCVRPGQNPNCWFSNAGAHITFINGLVIQFLQRQWAFIYYLMSNFLINLLSLFFTILKKMRSNKICFVWPLHHKNTPVLYTSS